MSNYLNTVLYVGVTNSLARRVWEHKNGQKSKSFTARYKTHKLVYYSCSDNPPDAIAFEKQLKAGSRTKKINLIKEFNPSWKDLSLEVGVDQMM